MVIGECTDALRMQSFLFYVTSWQQHTVTVKIENTPAPHVNVFRNYYEAKHTCDFLIKTLYNALT
ncbi:hypothetical protein C0J52_13088 [Blattella germanica]|nr:hypothetical protein C0J52_13088 [Blattella germanica]